MSSPVMEQIKDFLESHDVDEDEYEAYMHGVNVGIEIGNTDRLNGMEESEARQYFQSMYLKRRSDDV